MRTSIFPLILLAAIGVAPATALAQTKTGDPAAAQSLFYEARALMQRGQYQEACPKLEESMRLDPGMGTQFNLADCHEHIGKVASAWASYLEVAAQAKASGQAERERVARKRAQAVETRLPKLVVEVPSTTPGLEVKRDGIAVGSAAWGTSIPVDPGTHKITANAPGKQPWETTVSVAEGKTVRVSIPRDLPAAQVAAVAAPPAPTSAQAAQAGNGTAPGATAPVVTNTTTTTSSEYFPAPETGERGSGQRTAGWIVAGLGVAALGVGGGFGVASLSARDESRQFCTGDLCNARGVELRDDAIRNGNISTAAMIGGGAALAGGLILVFTAPRGSEKTETGKLRATPTVASGGAGISFGGSFR